MAETNRKKSSTAKVGKAHRSPTCTVGFCPICTAVTAVQPISPDAVEHFVSAAREFLLAAKSLLDAGVERTGVAQTGKDHLERIDIA
jgi:hypothetical protein